MIHKWMKAISVWGVLGFALTTTTTAEIPEKDQNILMFTGEVRNFVETAAELHDKTKNQSNEKEQLDSLYQTATRISLIYFRELTTENHPKLDAFLGKTIKENAELKNYFTILGNAFLELALREVRKQKDQDRLIKIWSTVGGAIVGLAVGGGYIYFTSLNAKSATIAATAIVGLTAVGYGVGVAAVYSLPVDRSVTNAQEFAQRYPNGEDFLKDLESNSAGDLQLELSELEGTRETTNQ
ncbi:MAG: hypothetical protein J0L93_03535 [Deltaproteobacteria bacterium]|nr:hypothetical protein [Deltaproteobacteria bacterium]